VVAVSLKKKNNCVLSLDTNTWHPLNRRLGWASGQVWTFRWKENLLPLSENKLRLNGRPAYSLIPLLLLLLWLHLHNINCYMTSHYLSIDMLLLKNHWTNYDAICYWWVTWKMAEKLRQPQRYSCIKTYFCFCVHEHLVHKISTLYNEVRKININFSYYLKIKGKKYNPVLKTVRVFLAS
jgi:hypothetical protein